MLRAIQQSDLEEILTWRNSPDVRKNMYTSHEISWEEHVNWFINYKNDSTKRYFMFNNGKTNVGVIYFTDYSPEQGSAFWGFYAGNNAPKVQA